MVYNHWGERTCEEEVQCGQLEVEGGLRLLSVTITVNIGVT